MAGPGSLIGVTGATGRIGRRFCAEALRCGYRVRELSRAGRVCTPGAELADVNLGLDDGVPANALEGCSAIVHAAAYIPFDHHSLEEGARCWEVNVRGTARLISAMRAAGVPLLLLLSSANAYAPWLERPDELAPLYPASRTLYLGSKIMQELVAAEECRRAGTRLATARISSVYGAEPCFGVVAFLARRLLERQPVELADEGVFGADFVLADDVVDAVRLLLSEEAEGIFNVASGTRTTIREIAGELVRLTGASADLVQFSSHGAEIDIGFPPIANEKIGTLGFRPTELRNGLARLLDSQRTLLA